MDPAFSTWSGTLDWVSAGHPPFLVVHEGEVTAYEATGRPVGLLPDQTYESGTLRLQPGDLFLLYSDGVTEAGITSPQGEFGIERLQQCMLSARDASELVQRIVDELQDHLGDEVPDDDVTVLCARCTS